MCIEAQLSVIGNLAMINGTVFQGYKITNVMQKK